MSVDCVIMVYKPDRRLNIAVDRLIKQKVKPGHIFLMITMEVLPEEDEVKQKVIDDVSIITVPVRKDEFNHGGTRKYAASLSRAEYVLFMTQDAVPKDRLLTEELCKSLEKGKAAVAYARQLPYGNASDVEKFAREYNYPADSISKSEKNRKELGIKTYFCSDVCAMYKKAVFDELGGFSLKVNFNEDMLYAYKAVSNGFSIEYNCNAMVYHSHNLSLLQQFKRNYEIAVSQKENSQIFKDIRAEAEGIKYLKAGIKRFAGRFEIFNTIDFIVHIAVRYAGFFAGKHKIVRI